MRFSRTAQVVFASSWKWLTMVTYSRGLKNIRSNAPSSKRKRFGTTLFKSWGGSKACMTSKLCTGISNAPICSWPKMAWLRWVTSTFQKLLRKVSYKRRLGPHTTQAQRCGKTSHTTTRVTFGVWDAYFMRWLLFSHHSERQACKVSVKKLSEVNMTLSLPTSVLT